MHPVLPGKDGYPKFIYHPTLTPRMAHDAKQYAEITAEDRRWSDKYIHQAYPRSMYSKDGQERVVNNEKEKRDLGNGWRDRPYDNWKQVPKPTKEDPNATIWVNGTAAPETAEQSARSLKIEEALNENEILKAKIAEMEAAMAGAAK